MSCALPRQAFCGPKHSSAPNIHFDHFDSFAFARLEFKMVSVGSIPMHNGVNLPLLGYGTWLSTDHEQLKKALRTALDSGYRYIDTAYVYGNEAPIGDVIKEYIDAGKLKRSDLFITTKLPMYANNVDRAEICIKRSLANLKTDYVDLYLIHTPTSMKANDDITGVATDENGKFIFEDVDLNQTWKILEKYYKDGTFKSIGISNFSARQIQDIYDNAEIKPMNLQVECHILFPQKKLVEFCKDKNITVTSYSSLGNPGRGAGLGKVWVEGDCLNHPLTLELANKYNKTPAQILLRHLVQRGISVIPKSVTESRIKENIDIFDFEIQQKDQDRLLNLNENKRLLVFDFAFGHPNYSFNDEF
ncbi:unnamed protein product [Bursaphelenchus xylophilus]|uniref:(pine wood nematode) hypothetical protein n=1 Tax=Bursaphelenchus xylophilus TaxID=6326 RepID=A0A1I7RNJ9_BURXY|nr:unnamed protein product [Bursaphelenchus xylophilus]CAG9124099.1 unnamed protein product [Bursaphelenchus xylophilus]